MKRVIDNPLLILILSYLLAVLQIVCIFLLTNYGFKNSNNELEKCVISFSWIYILIPSLLGVFVNVYGILKALNSNAINVFFRWLNILLFSVVLFLNLLIVYTYFVLNAFI
ncbi:MAG: hypothetical protein HY951_09580 [Bacteroidia bacterium]|nr:hypothetical protein [Bacteroidia bacterium]